MATQSFHNNSSCSCQLSKEKTNNYAEIFHPTCSSDELFALWYLTIFYCCGSIELILNNIVINFINITSKNEYDQ